MKRPDRVTLYAVYWPREGVLKIGQCCRASRYRELCATGGEVIFLMRDVPARWEMCALAHLDEFYLPAFERWEDSTHILPRGRGYTECFAVPRDEMYDALMRIYEGIRRYGHDEASVCDAGGVQSGGAAEPVADGTGDGDGVAVVCGRSRPREGEPAADPIGDLPAGRGDDGDDDRGATADARRCRMPDVVRRSRCDVFRGDGVAVGGSSCPVVVSRTAAGAFAIGSRFVRERFVAGERRERGGERRRERPRTIRSRSASVPVLRRPPGIGWHGRSLPPVRAGTDAAEGLRRRAHGERARR